MVTEGIAATEAEQQGRVRQLSSFCEKDKFLPQRKQRKAESIYPQISQIDADKTRSFAVLRMTDL